MTPSHPRRVAVIAVHGVADQAEGDSARRVADLLRVADPAAYSTFTEERFRFEVEEVLRAHPGPAKRTGALELREPIDFAPEDSTADRREVLGPRFAELALATSEEPGGGAREPARWVDSSLTARGRRLSPDDGRSIDVDVFELYWADLSRFRGSVARFLGQTFQLLVHLLTLGREALKTADEVEPQRRVPSASASDADATDAPDTTGAAVTARAAGGAWKLLTAAHRTAHRLFTLAVVPLNLLLLFLVPLALVSYLPRRVSHALFMVTVTAAALSWGALRARRSALRGWLAPSLALGSAGFASALVLVLAIRRTPVGAGFTGPLRGEIDPLFVVCALLAFAGFAALGRAYARHRPFADRATATLGGATFVTLALGEVAGALAPDWAGLHWSQAPSAHRVFWIAEIPLAMLVAAWILFAAAGLICALAHLAFVLRGDRAHWAGHRRAATTARITLVTPAALLFFGGFTVWALLGPPVARLDKAPFEPLFVSGWVMAPSPPGLGERDGTVHVDLRLRPESTGEPGDGPATRPALLVDWVQHLIALSGTSLMRAIIVVLAALFVILALPVVPGAVSDLSDRARSAWNSFSMGRGFDDGLKLARWAGDAFFVVFLGGTALALLCSIRVDSLGSVPEWARPSREIARWIGWLGGSAALSLATVFALGRRVTRLAERSSPLLDVLLDVDNHLRVSPPGARGNSRARIVARALGLLREIDRRGYDRVVVVAHSQGTAVVADLLRQAVHRRFVDPADPAAAVIDRLRARGLHLLTMGSPLRQLYHLRFPHLYGWVAEADITTLEVASWTNLYRTGDFIGRALWPGDDASTYAPGERPGGVRREVSGRTLPSACRDVCLGSGGHNRYWDSSAPEVALAIDRLIRGDHRGSIEQVVAEPQRA
jgi:hypothetical protein